MNTIEIASAPANAANGRTSLYRRILVATDFSSRAGIAFNQGLELARQNGAELLLLHAYPMPVTLSFLPLSDYDRWLSDSRNAVEARLKPLADQAHASHIRCHKLILPGLPEDVITEVARKLEVDLVVLGDHRRRGINRLVLGSRASRIANRLRCPVLTVTPSAPS